MKAQIAGNIFQQDLPAEGILHLSHAPNHGAQCFLGVGKRQQIVHIPPFDAGPAKVIGNPMRFDARGQTAHQSQVLEIDGIGAAYRERHPVHHQRKSFANAVQII